MKLVICGNYGATNIGDEAILEGILTLIKDVDPAAHITVFSANPADTIARHGVKSVHLLPAGPRSFLRGLFGGGMMKTFKVLKECDGFILGGGGLLSDEKPMAMVIWPLQAAFASLLRKPVFCLGQSVGPLKTFFGRRMARGIYSKALLASVRDTASRKVLHDLGIPACTVLADPAFAIHLHHAVQTQRENMVILSLRNWPANASVNMYKLFAHFTEWLWSEYGFKTMLMPFSGGIENDTQLLYNIFTHVTKKEAVEVFEYTGDYGKVLELISRSKAVVGMRLHSLIFATLAQTPFLALSYSDKVKNLAFDLGMADHTLNWAGIELHELKSSFKDLMENHEKVSMLLGEQNLLMRAKAREHERLLKTFFETIKKK